MAYNDYEPVIGLEIHAQFLTETKMFSSSSARYGGGDNEFVDAVCLGMPGTLPVLNKKAVELAIKTGLALNCNIRKKSVFSRKNYFYPDLPKGYQISQFDEPVCEEGHVEILIDGKKKRIGITRAHLEEDAGKSTHHGDYSLVNFNRSSVPLLEIVSEPDLRSPQEAAEYARVIRSILRYLEVCDGNLEEGSMRCDCNVSVRKKGTTQFGVRAELKNINSFRFIEKAIQYEIERQIDAIESGQTLIQETRLYDSSKNKTFSMRSKEEAQDYRYFPEPDLLPLIISAQEIEEAKKKLPELPQEKSQRFQTQYNLPEYDAEILTQEKDLADYFEEAVKVGAQGKVVSNWIMTELLRELNQAKIEVKDSPVKAKMFGELVQMIDNKVVSGKMAKSVFMEMFKTSKSAKDIVEAQGLSQITDEGEIAKLVDSIISANASQAEEYRSGKTKLFGFFVGQAMKASKGQANPEILNKVLKEKLGGAS